MNTHCNSCKSSLKSYKSKRKEFQNLGENLKILTNHLPNMYIDHFAYSQKIQLDFFFADQNLHVLSPAGVL